MNEIEKIHIDDLNELIAQQKSEIFCLQKIINSIPGSIYWKNKAGVYLGINRHAEQQMQTLYPWINAQSIIGKTDYDLFPFDVAEHYRQNDVQVMEEEKTMSVEESVYDQHGNEFIQLSSKQPLYDEKGHVIGVIGNTINITPQKKLEALQHEQEKMLERIKIAETLSASIAHEIKTPLAAILVNLNYVEHYLPLLLRAYQTACDHHLVEEACSVEEMQTLQEQVIRLHRYVHSSNAMINMMMMNITENPNIQASHFKRHSMQDSIQLALDEYPLQANERNIIHVSNENDFDYVGHVQLTKHVLFNLLKNALYFIKAEQKGCIYIRLERSFAGSQLIFEDTAKGIAPEFLPHIFERFVTHRRSGTGLGLFFCKTVMHAYGGTIECESELRKYTRFILTFPKKDR